jgi:hypothetical protein
MGTGSYPGVKSSWGMTLTPHPLPVPWSRKGRAIPLPLLRAIRPVQSLSACTKVHFTLIRADLILPHIILSAWFFINYISCKSNGVTLINFQTLAILQKLFYMGFVCSLFNVFVWSYMECYFYRICCGDILLCDKLLCIYSHTQLLYGNLVSQFRVIPFRMIGLPCSSAGWLFPVCYFIWCLQ